MSKLHNVPPEHIPICNALVAHALGKGPQPCGSKELEDFQSWILYLSGAMSEEDYECVVPLSRLHFDDDNVRFFLGFDDDALISDQQRLAYARQFIDTYGDDGTEDPYFAESFELPSSGGSKVFYCCLAQAAGMSVIDANWYGCFRDRNAFLEALRQCGYWVRCDPASRIPDSTLLARWYHPGR